MSLDSSGCAGIVKTHMPGYLQCTIQAVVSDQGTIAGFIFGHTCANHLVKWLSLDWLQLADHSVLWGHDSWKVTS